MRIKVLTRFRDGSRTYEEGDVFTVSGEEAIRFAAHGWAEIEDQASAAAEGAAMTDLQVHSSTLGISNKGL
jgi:hypothetical protein